MKVIAKTNDGYILEASKEDVRNIQGMYLHEKSVDIGDVIDIEGLFKKYMSVSSAFDKIESLRQTADLITRAADWIEQFKEKK